MKSWWTRSAISARFCTKYRTIQRPRCSPSPSIPPRFTIAIATTRKQYKVLAANKCSATFYGRRCSFYCHTESRFIERILFFPSPLSPARARVLPSSFYLRVETRRNCHRGGRNRHDHPQSSLDHPYHPMRVRHARCNSIYRRDLEILVSNRSFRFAPAAIPFTISFTIFPFVRISFNGM